MANTKINPTILDFLDFGPCQPLSCLPQALFFAHFENTPHRDNFFPRRPSFSFFSFFLSPVSDVFFSNLPAVVITITINNGRIQV